MFLCPPNRKGFFYAFISPTATTSCALPLPPPPFILCSRVRSTQKERVEEEHVGKTSPERNDGNPKMSAVDPTSTITLEDAQLYLTAIHHQHLLLSSTHKHKRQNTRNSISS
jgi:hypothetical protein